MSRFKSEPKRRRDDAEASSRSERLESASSDASGSAEAIEPASASGGGPASERSGASAARSGASAARSGPVAASGPTAGDPLWIPGPDATLPSPLPQPPEIQLVRHELPEDARLDARLEMLRDPDSTRAASFRVLRHQIADAGSPQVIAVTSPRERERKTTCAMNLALALAEPGHAQVLLVDGNRLRPELAHILRFVPPACFLAQVETRRAEPARSWRIVAIPSLGLHVLGIDADRERKPLMDGSTITAAFEELRLAGYDHIVIDTSPVLRSADLNLLQDAVDAVLLTAVERRTTARDLQNAVEQLTPAKILGTTLFER